MVINQLMENSRLMDSRLAEEDFPVAGTSLIRRQGQDKAEGEDVPLLDIPFMLSSFLLSQMLVHSIISVMEGSTRPSTTLSSLASHLASLLLWTIQFVWCAWMLNCPVLNLGEGGKIVIKRKVGGGRSRE